jgi:4-amino-4-deoxy-L-arabinose transferase-like glycosyltransferase
MKFPIGANFWRFSLLLVLSFFVFFWGLGDIPFYTRGEAREGLVVWEMYKTGNWILPIINGDYIPFKPPFFHWIGVVISIIAGDVNELTIRFASALFAVLGVALVYLTGTRLWNEKAGLFAALVLATNSEWWHSGTMAQVDMTLAFFVTASLLLFYFMYRERRHGKIYCMGLALLFACATLAKGPLGLGIPLLIIVIFLGLRHDLAFLKKLYFVFGALVFLIVAGGWYGSALWQGGSAFFVRQIIEENFGTAGGNYGHHQPYYYFLPVFFWNLAPWSFFSLPIVFSLYQRRRELVDDHRLFPLIWLVTVLVFFSVASGKRGVYILPLYPAFALLFGAWWGTLDNNRFNGRWLTSAVGYSVAASVLFVVIRMAFLIGNSGAEDRRFFPLIKNPRALHQVLGFLTAPSLPVWLYLIILGAAALVILFSLPRNRWDAVFIGLAAMATATTLFLKTTYYPAIATEETLKPFAVRLRDNLDSQASLLFYRAFDYGTIFYSRRHIASYSTTMDELKKRVFLLMWEEDWQRVRDENGIKLLDMSEGRGPADKHRLVLAESPEKNSLSGPEP